ncbi:MAG: hypothetical protein IH621_14180 [Krumholzibacteria bacterium]|nr:hypothetical protein [Candidatus Krumholzibacteria bacterium]
MFFTIAITIISLAILVGCVVAIVMSTSSGAAWLQSLWEGRGRGRAPDEGDSADLS